MFSSSLSTNMKNIEKVQLIQHFFHHIRWNHWNDCMSVCPKFIIVSCRWKYLIFVEAIRKIIMLRKVQVELSYCLDCGHFMKRLTLHTLNKRKSDSKEHIRMSPILKRMFRCMLSSKLHWMSLFYFYFCFRRKNNCWKKTFSLFVSISL